MKVKKSIAIGVVVVSVIGLCILATVVTSSVLAVRAFKRQDFTATVNALRVVQPFVAATDKLTLGRSATVQCLQTSLDEAAAFADLSTLVAGAAESYATNGSIDLQPVPVHVRQSLSRVQKLHTCVQENKLLAAILRPEQRDSLTQAIRTYQSALAAVAPLFDTSQTWVVVFQNNAELRATGGFTGSYALVELRDNTLQALAIEDIYDADGQISSYHEPPPGVLEYTSDSRGLRLPDANWWPDFPTSAQKQLAFFAEAGKENLAGVVALNVSLLQDILRVTGPVALLDYQTSLTADNATELLRSHALDFFPGSTSKKQLVSYALGQLQSTIASLDSAKKQELLRVFFRAAARRDIQAYSTNPEQQTAFDRLGLAAAINADQPVIALIESNVGINKSNAFITRSLAVHPENTDLILTYSLKNNADHIDPAAPASMSGYVNFQRVISSPELSVTCVGSVTRVFYDSATTTWMSKSGVQLHDAGFLLTLLPGQSKTLTFRLHPKDTISSVLLWHQSGTGSIPLTIVNRSNQTVTELIDSDFSITP